MRLMLTREGWPELLRRLIGHRFALGILAFWSFIEAIIFPIPPDVLLVPLAILRRDKVWLIAGVTTLASVAGGVVGYSIGFYFADSLHLYMNHLGFQAEFAHAQRWFDVWGGLAVLVAGFSPIPFKVFTLTAGLMEVNVAAFIPAALLGRGFRFFAEAALISWLGLMDQDRIKRVIVRLGWVMIFLFAILLILGRFTNVF